MSNHNIYIFGDVYLWLGWAVFDYFVSMFKNNDNSPDTALHRFTSTFYLLMLEIFILSIFRPFKFNALYGYSNKRAHYIIVAVIFTLSSIYTNM